MPGTGASDDGRFEPTPGLFILFVDDGEISRTVGLIPDPHTVEYHALLAGIELARGRGIDYVAVFSDSRTLVNQVNNIWGRREHLEKLCLDAQEALSQFKGVQMSWIPREWNKRADELASQALASG